jgi:hypothetical protein
MSDQNHPSEIVSNTSHETSLGASDATQPGQPNNTPEWKKMLEKIKPVLGKLFDKFYSNKLIFWSVCIFIGMVLLIIIVGSLFFRGKSKPITQPSPTPIPFILATPVATNSGDIISKSQEKLLQLKGQLEELDVKQKRLQPPTLDFEIKF